MTREATKSQVRIGREFFAKIKNDYADWRWALVREFLQNCFDAPGCDSVKVTVKKAGANTLLTVSNDGSPMTEDILVNKLLTLGGSGKNFDGENTGGFGVAKSLLYYTHLSYSIRTGSLEVTGEGAQFEITDGHDYLHGTTSKVLIQGDEAEALLQNFKRFASFAQWRGDLSINGEPWAVDLKKGARRKDLGWGVVYSNKSFSNVCLVRLNGQPMFTRYTRYKGCIIVELTGKANATLTSNRDSLVSDYASELSDLLTALAVDKRSALREQRAEYKRYLGDKLKNEAKKPKVAEQKLDDFIDVAALMSAVAAGPKTEATPSTATGGGGGIKLVVADKQDVSSVSLGNEFILKNTTGMVTPDYYTPGDSFSRYSKDLIRVWAALMLKMYQVHNLSGEFSVGFVLDEENEAEHECGVYGRVYYINPAKVVCQRDKPQCRSFKTRYTGAWANRFDLIGVAAHEFVHGAYGLGEHDEDYAGKLTEVMSTVIAHAKEFTALCRQ